MAEVAIWQEGAPEVMVNTTRAIPLELFLDQLVPMDHPVILQIILRKREVAKKQENEEFKQSRSPN